MEAEAFLQAKKPDADQPLYVVVGDERFLRRLVLERLQELILGKEVDELVRSVHDGDAATAAEVLDGLQTVSFFGGRRLAIVRDADPFVTRYREVLERWLARASAAGTLVLEVKKWPATTRLAKATPAPATIQCQPLKANVLAGWCVKWSAERHGKQLPRDAAELLVNLAGSEMGILDQELAKLACYVGESPRIGMEDVDRLVGHGRSETAWQMLDALAIGDRGTALGILDHLLEQGESPVAILGAVSWQLRKLAQVARLLERGESLDSAMAAAGMPPFARQRVQEQLRQSSGRIRQLYAGLLEADLTLKSTRALPERTVMERLLVKLAPAS